MVSMTRSMILLFRSSISASADSLAKGNTATDPTFVPFLRLPLGFDRLLRNRNKPVSPACYGFDVAGSGGRVSQGSAKSMYALVKATLEVKQSIVLPQMLLEFFSRV